MKLWDGTMEMELWDGTMGWNYGMELWRWNYGDRTMVIEPCVNLRSHAGLENTIIRGAVIAAAGKH